jgi:DUF2075 family protein/SOS-response transcriptional repressor LexA/predicted GIY-YIG superfamily endonuclease
MQEKFFVEVKEYEFSPELLNQIRDINFVKGCWPLVYLLHDDTAKIAYVGETTDAISRMSTHLRNSKKRVLKTVKLIMSDRFNKSATLDIESNLIRYMSGDGKYSLLNGNIGLANHNYYQQKELYREIFFSIWEELRREGVVTSELSKIDNSDLFKYSPYKMLTLDQRVGLISIIKALLDDSISTILVNGGAGTGKSILAIYLFKLLYTDPDELNFNDFQDDEFEFIRLVRELQIKFLKPKVGLVIPMSSFRSTIKKVFSKINGLRAGMVIGPAEVAKEKFDILIVDESHRLRRRVNLGAYFGAFDKVNEKLGFNKFVGTELDWVSKQSEKCILFYDQNQSIKPSDVLSQDFRELSSSKGSVTLTLSSQLRSLGGNDYVSFVDQLLNCRFRKSDNKFSAKNYDLKIFDSFVDFVKSITEKNSAFGLSRLIAGYSWEWTSRKSQNDDAYDIEIDGVRLRWNSTNKDWINSDNAINEVGCIHTTQGYDLNYVGIIFGNEISYDEQKNQIVINRENYFDQNGVVGVDDDEDLKQFIVNIYKTIMLRGIKGTYIFACDPKLREYLKRFIPLHELSHAKDTDERENTILTVSPYSEDIQQVPLYDSVGCGELMYASTISEEVVEVPAWLIKPGAKYFALRTKGDSMNLLGINDGDIILCQKNFQPSSGSNAVVIIGEDATLKQIKFEKDGLILIPKSSNPAHKIRKISAEDDDFKVIGVFVCKL